jgi:Integrase core domain
MTDNGSCYKSLAFQMACKRLKLRHIRIKPYTPKTNGKAERFIQTSLREWAYNVWEADADGQNYFVAVGRMSNIDWPWQLVVTVPRARQLEPASVSTLILIGVIGLAALFACAVGYAMSRAIGAPMAQLLTNAQLARNGNIELTEDVNTSSREIGEIDKILKEFAMLRRGKGPSAATASSRERSNNSG